MQKYLLVTLLAYIPLGFFLGNQFGPKLDTDRREESTSKTRTRKIGHPSFSSPHAKPIAFSGRNVFVVNTPCDTLDIIDIETNEVIERVSVGIDPVSVAVRPDGQEVWVANHISDSISVIDNNPQHPTYRCVVATIQDFDLSSGTTKFDEPVGIAFANNQKAYVALSSSNQIAVIDVDQRKVKKRLLIPSQDPRAIEVRNERLFVIPFESNNQTQLSGGNANNIDGDLVTFDAWNHSIEHNNVLSLGHVIDIVKNPEVPDQDLFVFDTKDDSLVESFEQLGTLLYGLTVDSTGRVFIAQTDARNASNGKAGTQQHGLKELENRAFLNQVTAVQTRRPNASATTSQSNEILDSGKQRINLEPLPPVHPSPEEAIATPFGIQVSEDDQLIALTAAGSNKLVTIDANSGVVLGQVDVESNPRGVALSCDKSGRAGIAWVFNAVANSVSVVDLTDPANPQVLTSVQLEDPTDDVIKQGRALFNDARASTTGTFSCASCHPDGHTDQLLWVLKTPVVSGGEQIMPRSTMPLRGLRDTAPFHWDGIPGDPYGGNNSAEVYGHVAPNSDPDDPVSPIRHLVDGAMASTMSSVGNEGKNDEGKPGKFSAAERLQLSKFLLTIPYPPAPQRAVTDILSRRARRGMELFHLKGDLDPSKQSPNVCGDCHRMPFLVSTNTPGTGMDAPTWRGAYDRWLILPQGRLNIVEFDFFRRVAEEGLDEFRIWQFSWAGRRRFNPVWDMVLENSTGFSGALGRQFTLSAENHDAEITSDLWAALESAADMETIVLEINGIFHKDAKPTPIHLQYQPGSPHGAYYSVDDPETSYSAASLLREAKASTFLGTFTARHGEAVGWHHPAPAIWTRGPIEQQRGRQEFPILFADQMTLSISGRHIQNGARAFVNGKPIPVDLEFNSANDLRIQLSTLPEPGTHFLRLQNPNGLFSNDFIFHVAEGEAEAETLDTKLIIQHQGSKRFLLDAIRQGDLESIKNLVSEKTANQRLNEQQMTPLLQAALYGQTEICKYLIKAGANVKAKNNDGNTALHMASFFCHQGVVECLLEHGANTQQVNDREETPIDVVAGPWNRRTRGVYRTIAARIGLPIDLKQIEKMRPIIAQVLATPKDKVRLDH